ncbi:hypothetical protein FDE76_14920 [Clostridium botulinum]|uniref:Uncharacterized protein n=1 Tax=Clostridium botulinum (strain Eklund 17B / Type B) TaxID=935198 RepID=B2TRZ2_CLOBB|nr:hypothetical protein CLL_A2284 [Clostridium botulinum B str. Eklund 17B (NRP)]MBY6975805.1 hypothetical protein [Clostridium botulinum]MBY7000228.1 hypothetical protein [Clostridium botulinum]MCR1272986.1 hypothetical protein [Clostridium botulinum]NFD71504.1 hypothetical protein [Clostridium botulinum]
MADSITIKVSELYERAKQMKDDGMDYVEVSILEDDDENFKSDPLPTTLWLSANSKKEPFESVEYEEIEVIETK